MVQGFPVLSTSANAKRPANIHEKRNGSEKSSRIAHRNHLFYAPIHEGKLARILSLMSHHSDDRVIDIGCGSCEIPIHVIERFGVSEIGVDLLEKYRVRAYERAGGRVPRDKLIFAVSDASKFLEQYTGPKFDMTRRFNRPCINLPG
jgi:ubiquinone/menaquinone biosynthesis C-methylase UbiE